MKVRLYSYWVNAPVPGIWSQDFSELVVDIPDGVKIVGCHPSSIGYELVLMEELPE